jgi:para-nitrobenzyl esterase
MTKNRLLRILQCCFEQPEFARGLWLAALIGLVTGLAGCNNQTSPTATVETGKLRGIELDGVQVFRGIPYAAPPLADLRWRPPQTAGAWQGVRDAQNFGPMCAQPDSSMLWFELDNSSEDCLTLNIITPDTDPQAALPVMVWIHGGGFSQGSGNLPRLNGTTIASKGVVLVTINYRLAVFGFMAHSALAASGEPVGNYGLLDVVAALEWVQRNIANFGGDAQRVTIFGESAGADAVNLLLVMPAAEGLFQQAISQSSSVGLAPAPRLNKRVGFNAPAEKTAEKFIQRLDIAGGDDLASALRALPADQLLGAMTERDRFPAIVDGQSLPDQPGILFAEGRHQRVPYITGGNSWEASLGLMIGGGFSPKFAARLVPADQKARLYPGLSGERLDEAIFGDLIILSHSRYLATLMQQHGAPVYSYYLSYVADDRRARQPGAAHTDDIAFVMNTLATEPDLASVSERDLRMAALMNDYWVQFAKTGDPNASELPPWPAFEPRQAKLLELGDEIVVRDGLLAERLSYHMARGQDLLAKSR